MSDSKNLALIYAKNCAEIGVPAQPVYLENLTDKNKYECVMNPSTVGKRLLDEDIVCIADTLREAEHIKSLNISGNGLQCASGRHVAQALAVNTTLETVDVSNNDIGDAGVSAIATSLAANVNSKVISLNFNSTHFGPEGAGSIMKIFEQSSTSLIANLSLEGNGLDCTSLSILARGLVHATPLKVLSLRFNNIGNDGSNDLWKALFEVARRHDAHGSVGLTSLDLSSNNIGDDGLRVLAAVARGSNTTLPLQRLAIRSNRLTDRSASVIANALVEGGGALSKVNHLYLGANEEFTERTLSSFSRQLSCAHSLKRLDLQNVPVSQESIVELAHAIQLNPQLVQLVINGNMSFDAVQSLHEISEALSSNTRLQELSLGSFDKSIPEASQTHAKHFLAQIAKTLTLNRRMAASSLSISPSPKPYRQPPQSPRHEAKETSNALGVRELSLNLWTPLRRHVDASPNINNLSIDVTPPHISDVEFTGVDELDAYVTALESDNGDYAGEAPKTPLRLDSPAVEEYIINSSTPVAAGVAPSSTTSLDLPELTRSKGVTAEILQLRATLQGLHDKFASFESAGRASPTEGVDQGLLERQISERLAEHMEEDVTEKLKGTVQQSMLDAVIESLHEELERETVTRANSMNSVEERLKALEEESKLAKSEREQTAKIISALSEKVDQAIALLKDTISLAEENRESAESGAGLREVEPSQSASPALEKSIEREIENLRNEMKSELTVFDSSLRAEMTVFEGHVGKVSHRLGVLEETFIRDQESNLNALETILQVARQRSKLPAHSRGKKTSSEKSRMKSSRR
eukprot:Stramenopile-MAST_4_protein_3100